MTYKDKFKDIWVETGGLITKVTAARILGVDRSAITRRTKNKSLNLYLIDGDEFLSLQEVLNNKNIKPRRKRRTKKNEH